VTIGTYNAVIFDMDGVLADSEPVYVAAIDAVLASQGKKMDRALHEKITGHGVHATWETLIEAMSLPGNVADYLDAYDRELQTRLAKLRDALPGVQDLIAALKRRRIPIAVASSSWLAWVDALLTGIGLRDAFDAVASATEVENPKPAPDLYLLAASRIGMAPERCVAVEDTPTGLTAARAAGMLAIQVRSASTAFPPLPEADIVLASLEDFDLNLLM
jgi:pseudouridine-5'-monophosphatase